MSEVPTIEIGQAQDLLHITKDLIIHPARAFESMRSVQQLTGPVVFLTVIGFLGLGNEVLLLSKVLVTELPPLGFQGPAMALNLLDQIPGTIYLYYFLESLIFTFFQGLFNFFVIWITASLISRWTSVRGDAKTLFAFSFFSLAPLMITGAASLLPSAMLPHIVISPGESSYLYMTALSRNAYYMAWEYLGWGGEIWAALLAAYSTRVSHSINGVKLGTLMGIIALVTFLRIYFIF